MSFDDEFSWFLYFIGAIVNGLIWGAISKAIIGGKGYDEATQGSYYWIGFFLGLIGFIVALAKPQEKAENKISKSSDTDNTKGWRCSYCGRWNTEMFLRCNCGRTKFQSDYMDILSDDNVKYVKIIKKYKELLDMGAITQEDYDRKKTELLG